MVGACAAAQGGSFTAFRAVRHRNCKTGSPEEGSAVFRYFFARQSVLVVIVGLGD